MEHPQCMLCNNKFSNSSLAPAKLREHFSKVYNTGKYAGTTHDQFKQKNYIVKNRIDDISQNILHHVVANLKDQPHKVQPAA